MCIYYCNEENKVEIHGIKVISVIFINIPGKLPLSAVNRLIRARIG